MWTFVKCYLVALVLACLWVLILWIRQELFDARQPDENDSEYIARLVRRYGGWNWYEHRRGKVARDAIDRAYEMDDHEEGGAA